MTVENYALGARGNANDARLNSRPDSDALHSMPLRKCQIVSDNGVTCTVRLVDDNGDPILDANEDPVELTRVPRYPALETSGILWIDTNGNPYVLSASGGGGALSSFGVCQGWDDQGFDQ